MLLIRTLLFIRAARLLGSLLNGVRHYKNNFYIFLLIRRYIRGGRRISRAFRQVAPLWKQAG